MSNRVSRREFLTAGATLTGGALLGSALGCTSDALVAPPATLLPTAMRAGPDRDLLDPREFRSRGGVLRERISIGSGPVNLVGSPRFAPITYDNLMPGPSLLVNAGDTVDLTFYNRIRIGQADRHPGYGRRPRPHDTVTNVHFHGLHITPMGSGDNMLVMTECRGSAGVGSPSRLIAARTSVSRDAATSAVVPPRERPDRAAKELGKIASWWRVRQRTLDQGLNSPAGGPVGVVARCAPSAEAGQTPSGFGRHDVSESHDATTPGARDS